MAKAAKLKVYRTPTGFHDAYVAAPSQKAALDAWGADANLFTRGVAEQVTDQALMEAALASPGQVIKRLRGTADEQIAALGPVSRKRLAHKRPKAVPSRAKLDAAEMAIAEAKRRQSAELAVISKRERDLAQERRALLDRLAAETKQLEDDVDAARRAYEKAVRN